MGSEELWACSIYSMRAVTGVTGMQVAPARTTIVARIIELFAILCLVKSALNESLQHATSLGVAANGQV